MTATRTMGLFSTLLLPILLTTAQNSNNQLANTTVTAVANASNGTLVVSNTTQSTPEPEDLDFIAQLNLKLDEKLLPEFVINRSNEKVVDANEILQLYISKIKYLNLQNTTNFIVQLGCEPSNVFNIDNFGFLLENMNMINSFNKLYEAVRQEFKFGTKLLNATGVNMIEFSMAFISDEAQAWAIFKQGNFSKENLENAVSSVNRTLDDLFEFVKKQFIDQNKTLTYDQIMNISGNCVFQQEKYLNLWKLLNVTREDVMKSQPLSLLLSNFSTFLSKAKLWGIVVDSTRVAVNQAVLDYADKVEFADGQFTTLNNSYSLSIEQKLPSDSAIVFFNYKSNQKLSTISYDLAGNNLSNCYFFTNNNGSFNKLNATSPIVDENIINVTTSNIGLDEFILGSPIYCDGKAYGLAKSFESGNMTFDKFPKAPAISATASSSASTISMSIHQRLNVCALTASLIFSVVCFLSKIF